MKEKKIKIALLGLGLDNQALLKLFSNNNYLEITICDKRKKDDLPKIDNKKLKINYRLENNFNLNLSDFDILFRSPGWPINCPGIQSALKNGSYLSSPLDLFFKLCKTKNIIGVTGTKGKGTTATLIYKIIKEHLKTIKTPNKPNVYLGGNIGISPLNFLKKIKSQDYVVLELSSFQLEDLKHSVKVAVFTNLFKEHLVPADPNNPNFHKSIKAYFNSKLNIARYKENEILIANKNLEKKLSIEKLKTKIIYFTESFLKTKIKGDYNRQNIAAAIEVAKYLKIKPDIYQKTINNFKNLENRLELVTTKNQISFFNNSFSTTPESTALDLLSFDKEIIQLAGGAHKGADFKSLAKIIKRKVKFLILFPGLGSEKIKTELIKINFPQEKMFFASNMKIAVKAAWKKAKTNDIILLSTACASFGLFKNYKERGLLFKQEVKKIK